jgi:predicted chitinase
MSVRSSLIVAGTPAGIAAREAPLAEAAMIEFAITTQARAQMFLAQVMHESVALQFFEEIASGAAYEGRRDLGNTHPGDGVRYKGRGPIQLTGRANYRWAGGQLGLPLEASPQLAAQHAVGWRIAGLYWRSHDLNALADRGDFLTITSRINGGFNGLAARQKYLARLRGNDCCPRDRWAGYTPAERRWIAEYDRSHDPARRRVLRRVMTTQRKVIWKAAEAGGWDKAHRRERYRSLKART